MSAEDCLFCRMAAGKIPVSKIYDDEVVLAFLDIGPISDGHTLVIPKQHFEKLHECPAEVLSAVAARLGKIAKAVTSALNYEGYNVLCNNGPAAGQVIEHLHFHIIGRSSSDGLFNKWPSYRYQAGKIEDIADRIRKKL
jgi:histidine triad (HIT) family protein